MALTVMHTRRPSGHCGRSCHHAAAGFALAVSMAVPSVCSAMGSGAPFTPPRAAATSASASSSGDDSVNAVVASGLSGVRTGHRAAALIDGQWLAVGDTVRGARVLSVQADAATLRHADGRIERLLLNPAALLSAKTMQPVRLTFTPARAQRPIAEK